MCFHGVSIGAVAVLYHFIARSGQRHCSFITLEGLRVSHVVGKLFM